VVIMVFWASEDEYEDEYDENMDMEMDLIL
jgi:hypothetical protein